MNKYTIQKLIAAANQYDTQTFINLFAENAMIDDVSVGETFKQHTGIKKYFSTYFIDYHTQTRLISLEGTVERILAKIDFTGDFGHETGGLHIWFNKTGLIRHIDAYLD